LSSLRSFPFDKIKIDKSFAQGLGTSDHAFAIIEAVAGIAARLEIATTAEGVETDDQLAWVRALGVTEVQGYFTGRPSPSPIPSPCSPPRVESRRPPDGSPTSATTTTHHRADLIAVAVSPVTQP
jgi:EAL domain-containing protein (putative c-di-GMP-specific phosphodiesterase class I)